MYVGICIYFCAFLICRGRSDDTITASFYCRGSACYALIKTFPAYDVYQTSNLLRLYGAEPKPTVQKQLRSLE